MKKLLLLLIIIGVSMLLSDSCSKDYDCYDCKEYILPKTLEDLYNGPRYNLERACGDEEAIFWESQGYDCEGYTNTTTSNNPSQPIAAGTPGSRIVPLITPPNNAVNVNLDVTLQWSGMINWYKSPYDPGWLELAAIITSDVYLGTEVIPTKIVNSSQANIYYDISYIAKLEANTKYYWKITAKNSKGEIAQSEIRSFTTKP